MIKKKYLMFILLVFVGILSGCSNTLENFLQTLEVGPEVSGDIDLKNEYEFNGKTIKVEWITTNEEIISSTGKVTRTLEDQQVILTCKASLGSSELTRNFTVTVLADTTPIVLQKALIQLEGMLSFFTSTTQSIALPNQLEVDDYNVSISWTSSDTSVMDDTGKIVKLPKKDKEITLTALVSCKGNVDAKSFKIVVMKDPDYSIGADFSTSEVYTGVIENEAKPTPVGKFDGAIYRKVTSSTDYWLGIEVVVTLPEYHGDPGRMSKNPYGSENDMRYNDNASVYLGGHSGAESDVGLTWSMGVIPGTNTIDYSKSVAFRPFWRYIHAGKNTYANASVQDTQYYYYPGDKIRMSVYATKPGYLQLRIDLLEETTIPEYVELRKSYNLGDNYSKLFLSPEFPSSGMGSSKAQFKRCCALDQVGNEGGKSQPTNAQSLNIIWHEVYLYREINNNYYKVPMTSQRRAELSWPGQYGVLGDFTNAIKVSYDGVDTSLGGEIVSIDPNNRK